MDQIKFLKKYSFKYRLLILYLTVSISVSLFLNLYFLPNFAPSALRTDFLFYKLNDVFEFNKFNFNYGFSFLIKILNIQSLDSFLASSTAYIAYSSGVLFLTFWFYKFLKIKKYNKLFSKKILIFFVLIISINPFFSISRLRLTTESFVFLGIGLTYFIYQNFNQFLQKVKKQTLIYSNSEEIRNLQKSFLLINILLLLCLVRNILFANLIILSIYFFLKIISIKNFNFIFYLKKIYKQIFKSYFLFILIVFFIFLVSFNFALFLDYVLTYLQNNEFGILSKSALNDYTESNLFELFFAMIKKMIYRIISLLGFRASMANNYNIFIDNQDGHGYLISKNVFLTNLMPALLYIPFNISGILLSFKNKFLRPYLYIILPSVLPSAIGFSHMRYLYPAVPIITMAWSIFLANTIPEIVDKLKLKFNL